MNINPIKSIKTPLEIILKEFYYFVFVLEIEYNVITE